MATSIKTCFKCETEKPITDFYRHPEMGDGHLGKCKECTKADVRKNRKKRLDYYTDYDRRRAMQPHRVATRHQYQQTEQGRGAANRAKRAWSERNPKKRDASHQVNNAVRDGKLAKPDACEECGAADTRIHGHHDDYNKPLDVRWLCPACHSAWHKENGEAANAV